MLGVKETVKKKFPNNTIWNDENWYKEQRSALNYLVNKTRMMKGLNCSDKAYPLCRHELEEICKHLYQKKITLNT